MKAHIVVQVQYLVYTQPTSQPTVHKYLIQVQQVRLIVQYWCTHNSDHLTFLIIMNNGTIKLYFFSLLRTTNISIIVIGNFFLKAIYLSL